MHCLRRFALAYTVVGICFLGRVAGAAEQEPVKPSYVALGEFTVNLPQNSTGLGYLVVNITLEAVPAEAKGLTDMLPRLQETVTRKLMNMAKEGSLTPGQIEPSVLKDALLRSLNAARPSSIRDILITRLLFG